MASHFRAFASERHKVVYAFITLDCYSLRRFSDSFMAAVSTLKVSCSSEFKAELYAGGHFYYFKNFERAFFRVYFFRAFEAITCQIMMHFAELIIKFNVLNLISIIFRFVCKFRY